jgi:hypothetical protein
MLTLHGVKTVDRMCVEHWWDDAGRGNPRSRCHFVH